MENKLKKNMLFKGFWVTKKSPTLFTKELSILLLDFSTLNLEKRKYWIKSLKIVLNKLS